MEWLFYLLKVSACTGLFYLFYFCCLRKLTFFGMNRWYLLITLILSFMVPGLEFKVEALEDPALEKVSVTNRVDQVTGIALPIDPTEFGQEEFISGQFDWSILLNATYMIAAIGMLLFFIYQMATLLRHMRDVYVRVGKLRVIYKPHGFTNCSFMNYVFVDQEDFSGPEISMLLQHESIHASHYHSVDKLLAAFCKIVLWFNPFIYLYEQELEQLHEYEADQGTSKIMGTSMYAELLLVRATDRSPFSLVHNFSRNPLKERIKMLFHHQSKEMKKLIYCASVPLLAILLWGFSVDYVSPSSEITDNQKDSSVYGQQIKLTSEMLKGKQVLDKRKDTDDFKPKVIATNTSTSISNNRISPKKTQLPKTFNGKVDYKQDVGEERVEYSAKDSVVVDEDQLAITLYGKASLKYKKFNVSADQIKFDTKNQTGVARNATFYNSGSKSKAGAADSVFFDLRSGKSLSYGIK